MPRLRPGAGATVLALLLVAGCSGSADPRAAPSGPELPPAGTPGPLDDGTAGPVQPGPATPGSSPQEPPIPETGTPYRSTEPAEPPGRKLADSVSGPLRFTDVRVQRGDDGLTVMSNVTNAGSQYLNRSAVAWQILIRTTELGSGRQSLPPLAPGETTTVVLGPLRHDGRLDHVAVQLLHAS